MTIELDTLGNALDGSDPAGPDLDEAYDEAFQEFERLVDQQDWAAAKEQALGLFERTRDLRLAVHFARVLLELDGITGFAEGVALIRMLVENLWDSVHPALDEEFPPLRTNVLMGLSLVEGSQSVNPMHDRLRRTHFVRSKTVGSYSFRDYQIATGAVEITLSASEEGDNGQEIPTTSLINAAVQESDRDDLIATAAGLASIIADAGLITGTFADKIDTNSAPNLSSLIELARDMRTVLVELGGLDTAAAADDDDDAATGNTPAAAQNHAPGEINSRQDAIVALEKVSRYFELHEPSSPVPLVIGRAKRLVSMTYMEVLAEMTPDAISDAERITGPQNHDG
ncbi:MAG: type VI secretion system protein TssA [Pseudomonadales bacterium]